MSSRKPVIRALSLSHAIAAMFLLPACATGPDEGTRVRGSWVGAPVAELVAAWGVPTRRMQGAAGELLVYQATRVVHMPGSVDAAGMKAGEIPAMDVPMSCETTFVASGGTVASWKAEGDDCRYAPVPPRAPR